MCGICGAIALDPEGMNHDESIIESMVQTLHHRGPDDDGYFTDNYVMLGMRRLSIIDLVTGQQPITNEDHTLHLIYNGEIYNYQVLREVLIKAGHFFKSRSDAEVVIHAYEEYGDSCVEKFNGIFAFALWDSNNKRLLLARDRLGIKPLYYWIKGNKLVFGSELKAVIAHPEAPKWLDFDALDQFLALEYIPNPRTIYKDINKLAPGHLLIVQGKHIQVKRYWDVYPRNSTYDDAEFEEKLAELISDSVRLQMVSDVPLGAFLSGGIDSSTVLSYMYKHSTDTINTFSIGFDDRSYNELPDAGTVAKYFSTEHNYAILQPDISALAEKLLTHIDEPLADFSIFPTYLVSEMASRSVKVVLSGDGGDELFGGYDTYLAESLYQYYHWLPEIIRMKKLPALTSLIPPRPSKKGFINKTKRWIEGAALPESLRHTRWMIFMSDVEKDQLYTSNLKSQIGEDSTKELLEKNFLRAAAFDQFAQGQYVDLNTYLVDDILTKLDRMSMAASIEARVPLLDHRIVDFALNLPPKMKMRFGKTKVILRRTMKGKLPENVLSKPKQGFSIPMKHWLRGPLKSMMLDMLSYDSINRQSFFEPNTVQQLISEHLDRKANHSHRLWALCVFQMWYQKYLPSTL